MTHSEVILQGIFFPLGANLKKKNLILILIRLYFWKERHYFLLPVTYYPPKPLSTISIWRDRPNVKSSLQPQSNYLRLTRESKTKVRNPFLEGIWVWLSFLWFPTPLNEMFLVWARSNEGGEKQGLLSKQLTSADDFASLPTSAGFLLRVLQDATDVNSDGCISLKEMISDSK